MRFEEWRVDDSKLDDDQRIIVFGGNIKGSPLLIKDNFVVQGSAGSGKTIMAVRKSIIFGSLPNQNCVVLVCTKALKLMLQNGLDYYKSVQRINHRAKAVYAWAWQYRGMDLDGEVFRKKGSDQELYLRDGNNIYAYKCCDNTVREKYETKYKDYIENYSKLSPKERKQAEDEFTKLVSIDFADHVVDNLYRSFGRRTKYFERVNLTTSVDLQNNNDYENIPKGVIFTKKPKVDYLIVDEAQDFSQKDVQGFIGDKSQSIVFFGDTLQQLYSNSGLSLGTLATNNKFPIVELSKNYRLPKDVARVAEYIQPKEKDKLLVRCQKGYNNETLPTFYLKDGTKEDQLKFIINHCKNPLNSKDIGILVSTNKQVEEVVNFLFKNGEPCQYRFNKPLGGFGNSYIDFMDSELGSALYNQFDTLNFQSNLPCVLTYHSAKGTQFDTVFIPFANDDLYRNGLKRNEFYVAITRTSNQVFVLYQDKVTALVKDVPEKYITRK
ncbi:MAG: ATP-binding domain-containing protein [Phycisphaerales bacterium]|nr:ATP-binding domain-containing protein [Phycisphaerales bacterium]